MQTKTNIRESITHSIVELIESGKANGEQSLWDCVARFGMPVNYMTRRAYNGINVPIFWAATYKRGYEQNYWLTFKQAKELGGTVRKGAKGVMGVFFKMVGESTQDETAAAQASPSEAAAAAAGFPMMRPFWAFNVAEIDGLEGLAAPRPSSFEAIGNAEALLNASGADVVWSGFRAYYDIGADRITMPSRARFASPVNAYAVAMHELTHWTGHSSRLDRKFGAEGSDAYAYEELVAELGSAFLVAHLGLEGALLENHANYLEHYLRLMKSDTSLIFSASARASAACSYILSLSGALSMEARVAESEAA